MDAKLRSALRAIVTVVVAGTGSREWAADPPAVAPAAAAPLVGGVARTAEEVARCREEEETRIGRGDRRGRVPPPAEPVRLRSKPVELPDGGCEAAAKKYNFYYFDTNQQGCFANAYRRRDAWVGGIRYELVADLATRLVWLHLGNRGRSKTYRQAKDLIASLPAERFAGFTDWRLPTTEELLSLGETLSSGTTNFDTGFFDDSVDWWSADRWEGGKYAWMVSLFVSCGPGDVGDPWEKASAMAVRSMRDGETFDETEYGSEPPTDPGRNRPRPEPPRRPSR